MTKIINTYKKTFYFILFFLTLFSSSKVVAQDVIYFNENWEKTTKEAANFYRPKPLKFNAKDILGYKVKNIDSIFQIKDYYIKNDSLQFQGYAVDSVANYLLGTAIWYDSMGTKIATENYDFSFKKNHKINYRNFFNKKAINVGYHYLAKSKNSGYVGLDIRLNNTHVDAFNLGFGTYVTEIENKSTLLPAIQVNYTANQMLLMELSSSNRFFKPTVGFNLLNLLHLKMGYNFWYSDKQYNGFTFGVNICLGGKNFYDYVKFGW